MKKKRSKKWIIWLAILALIVVAFSIYTSRTRKSVQRYGQEDAKIGSLTTYYSFSGSMEIRDSETIQAEDQATVREVYVQENDVVNEGDRLVRLSDGSTLRAGIHGEVTSVHVEKDDSVSSGTDIMEIVNFDGLEAVIKVDEFDVSAIAIGKQAQITVPSLNYTFEGTILELDKQATKEGDISYYKATLLSPQNEMLLPGMQVDVKVKGQSVENATLLPMAALQFDDYNQPYVLMRDKGRQVYEMPVKVGLNDGISVVIIEGVSAGETVLIPQSAEAAAIPLRMLRR